MDRKFLIGWLAVFVVWMLGSFLVHGFLLGADYSLLQGKLFRTPEDSRQHFHLMLLAHVCLAGALTWIYARGCESSKAWMAQGFRFGIAIVLLTVVPNYMVYFVVQPTPGMLAIKQTLFDGALLMLLSLLLAWWYRDKAA